MPTTLLAPDATASLGGYEWRLHELLTELNASTDADHKASIRHVMQQVAANFDRAYPGKPLVLAPYPFPCPCAPTSRFITAGESTTRSAQ